MKAFLLAAGNGTRLRPLTDKLPKCLVPIRGKPLLEIWLELLESHGVREILINLHAHADVVRQFLSGRFPRLGIRLEEEPQLFGSAGTLAAHREWLSDDSDFWILYADVLTNVDLGQMSRFHKTHASAATLGVYNVSDPRRCGIAVVDDAERVLRFLEKPKDPPGNLAFAGVMIGTRALLEAIPSARPADIGFDVLPRLAGDMFAYRIQEFLLDIGTVSNYEHAQSVWPGL
jgi:mannose-1-phosphate guanylyltransferase